jgi:hypothetical protein
MVHKFFPYAPFSVTALAIPDKIGKIAHIV